MVFDAISGAEIDLQRNKETKSRHALGDGLDFAATQKARIKKVLEQASKGLAPGGIVVIEFKHDCQAVDSDGDLNLHYDDFNKVRSVIKSLDKEPRDNINEKLDLLFEIDMGMARGDRLGYYPLNNLVSKGIAVLQKKCDKYSLKDFHSGRTVSQMVEVVKQVKNEEMYGKKSLQQYWPDIRSFIFEMKNLRGSDCPVRICNKCSKLQYAEEFVQHRLICVTASLDCDATGFATE